MRKLLIIILLLVHFPKVQARPFVIGNLTGQLGNQMFVIAATVSLALDNDADALFPDLQKRKEDNTPLNFQKVFYNLNSFGSRYIAHYYYEPSFDYTPIPFHKNMSISGYFQSEKYFINHKKEILEIFAAPLEISEYLHDNYDEIINNPNTVSIHVRSYLKEDPLQKVHNTLELAYYEKAILYFPEDFVFIVFSNCPERCKQMFSTINRKFIYIEKEAHYHDLYLMSFCKHHIIANSSFSWWGSYLNSNPNKIVIAPARWFNPLASLNTKDLYLKEWIIID